MTKIIRLNLENAEVVLGLLLLLLIGIFWQPLDPDLSHLCNYRVRVVELGSHHDILALKEKTAPNIVYKNVLDLSALSVDEKKKKFIAMLLPSILIERERLEAIRQKLIKIRDKKLSRQERKFLARLYKKYRTKNIDVLIERLHTHPNSIILAQAATESGWGSSRFFLHANNIFGIWSFNEAEKRVQADLARGNKKVYVRKYDNVLQSISDYFLMISKSPYFERFRSARTLSKEPLELVQFLLNYSELREEYIQRLTKIIQKNNLQYYDDFYLERLAPIDVARLIY